MSMLAEKRRRVKWSRNPNGHVWIKDKNKYGHRLLEKMGWQEGSGLGAQLQGIKEHIRLNQQHDTRGLGYKTSDDKWLSNQSEFENLLTSLSASYNTQETNDVQVGDIQSLEEKSKNSKRRLHYQKFTRGKDLSRYTAKDLECVLGVGAITNNISGNDIEASVSSLETGLNDCGNTALSLSDDDESSCKHQRVKRSKSNVNEKSESGDDSHCLHYTDSISELPMKNVVEKKKKKKKRQVCVPLVEIEDSTEVESSCATKEDKCNQHSSPNQDCDLSDISVTVCEGKRKKAKKTVNHSESQSVPETGIDSAFANHENDWLWDRDKDLSSSNSHKKKKKGKERKKVKSQKSTEMEECDGGINNNQCDDLAESEEGAPPQKDTPNSEDAGCHKTHEMINEQNDENFKDMLQDESNPACPKKKKKQKGVDKRCKEKDGDERNSGRQEIIHRTVSTNQSVDEESVQNIGMSDRNDGKMTIASNLPGSSEPSHVGGQYSFMKYGNMKSSFLFDIFYDTEKKKSEVIQEICNSFKGSNLASIKGYGNL